MVRGKKKAAGPVKSGRGAKEGSAKRPARAAAKRPVKAAKAKTKRVMGVGAESSEERIKAAARKLFTQKGFAATRTRDIAEEAGINLALLNYYFRSKQKLFDLIMTENFQNFLAGITIHVMDEKLSLEERVTRIVKAYIDFATEFPDLPLFVINEIRGNPSRVAIRINEQAGLSRSHFLRQIKEANEEGKSALEPFHFIANLVGLTIFPFVAKPILLRVTGIPAEQFDALMQDRRELVPMWLKMMMTPDKGVSKKR
jgi:AcrR family transcriptional regulator